MYVLPKDSLILSTLAFPMPKIDKIAIIQIGILTLLLYPPTLMQ